MRNDVVRPKVSVVIPTYNRANDLRRCLNSLVAQTTDRFEVLICDDGSTDDSALVAEEFFGRLDLHFEAAENFGGPARPRNRGVARARAPYLAFLDSDDWWEPTKLERSIKALDSGADLVYHDLYTVEACDQQVFKKRLESTEPKHPLFLSLLCSGMSVPNSSVVVRRELLVRAGGISEDRELISVEDYDTWIRLSRLTERFVRLPECLGYYWMGGGNISAASPRQVSRIRALYAQYLDVLPAFERKRAEGFLAYRVGRISQAHGDHGGAAASFRKAMSCPIDSSYRLKALLFFLVCLKKGWFL